MRGAVVSHLPGASRAARVPAITAARATTNLLVELLLRLFLVVLQLVPLIGIEQRDELLARNVVACLEPFQNDAHLLLARFHLITHVLTHVIRPTGGHARGTQRIEPSAEWRVR